MISHSFPSLRNPVIDRGIKSIQEKELSERNLTKDVEGELAEFTDVRYAKLMGSGYAALQSALVAIGVGSKSIVTIPNITCPSVYHAVKSLGATPRVIDVGISMPIITTDALEAHRVEGTVIVANMFGLRADIQPRMNCDFIEDNAQCFNSQLSDWASIGTYSFSPTKIFTIGYGGAVVTNDNTYIEKVREFLDVDHTSYNNESTEENFEFRIHSNIADYQSAMLKEQLSIYPDILKYREKIVSIYDEVLRVNRLSPQIPFRYQIILEKPVALEVSTYLKNRGVMAQPLASHLLSDVLKVEGLFPNSNWWKAHLLSIPLHEGITFKAAYDIAKLVREAIQHYEGGEM